MYKDLTKLVLYRSFERDNILSAFAEVSERVLFSDKKIDLYECRNKIHAAAGKLLDVATRFGFDNNLWHNYLTFLLLTDENPFSVVCERSGFSSGSASIIAKKDFAVFIKLFSYDFTYLEERLATDIFGVLTSYKSIEKRTSVLNSEMSTTVRILAARLSQVKDVELFFDIVVDYYKNYGVGFFAANKAFTISENDKQNDVSLIPVPNFDPIIFESLVGYERQKSELIANTEAFLAGRAANNVLLYGDSGTGKSTSIKALINLYHSEGLRLIEIHKHQSRLMGDVISQIKHRNYRFILYMDDLSFEENETEYKYLKAVIEGASSARPENVLIYATSNRRHIIRENFGDRDDVEFSNDVHRSETMEEKLSLAHRFGLAIGYFKPSKNEFENIVLKIAENFPNITLAEEEILRRANIWQQRYGGISGRTARQFVNSLLTEEN